MDTTFTPEEAAPMVGMAASTIRLWCKTYAVGLSDGANPPPNTERRLTQQDVATLQQVKVWRDDRIPTNEIVTLLQAAASRNEQAHYTIEVQPAPQSPQNAQEAPGRDLLLPAVISAMQSQIDTLQRQHETRRRADMLWHIGTGVWIGLLLAGLILLIEWLATNGAPW